MLNPNLDVSEMFHARESERSAMHTKHLNEQLVRVLKTIGYDVGFRRGQGQYLYDRNDEKYLDLLSGFGVFEKIDRAARTAKLDTWHHR